MTAFEENCTHLLAERRELDWCLHYSVRGNLHSGVFHFWHFIGGPPRSVPEKNPVLKKFAWDIPDDLLAFYSVHDGFECTGRVRARVLSSSEITVMADYMNPIAEEIGQSPEGYCFEDLLEFCPDGGGNAQCFRREGHRDLSTVDWEHESWELDNSQPFFEFVDQQLSNLYEE